MAKSVRCVDHIFKLIGNTPLVKLQAVNRSPQVEIYGKLEGFNPMGSLKDRAALHMIEQAETSGTLRKDQIIVEATSGNTGISLTWVARLKGYHCLIILPVWVSIERKQLLSALGAELILVESEAAAIQRAQTIAEDPHYFFPNQFQNEHNWRAHYLSTAPEIWEQTQGRITHFVAGIGTSGTLMGVGRRLHEYNPQIQIIGVQPATIEHRQEGLVNQGEFLWPLYDARVVDQLLAVTDDDARRTVRNLLRREGLFLGISSGTVVYGALQVAQTVDQGVIVAMCGDHGFKYLSTDLYR